MGLKEELMKDFKEAMKARDEVAKNTISLARAAVKQFEVDKREELDDAGVVAILQKQIKMRKDALADFEKAGRQDLLDAYNAEIKVLSKYIPEQLSKEKIEEIVRKNEAQITSDVLCAEICIGKTGGTSKEWEINTEKAVLGVEVAG